MKSPRQGDPPLPRGSPSAKETPFCQGDPPLLRRPPCQGDPPQQGDPPAGRSPAAARHTMKALSGGQTTTHAARHAGISPAMQAGIVRPPPEQIHRHV